MANIIIYLPNMKPYIELNPNYESKISDMEVNTRKVELLNTVTYVTQPSNESDSGEGWLGPSGPEPFEEVLPEEEDKNERRQDDEDARSHDLSPEDPLSLGEREQSDSQRPEFTL